MLRWLIVCHCMLNYILAVVGRSCLCGGIPVSMIVKHYVQVCLSPLKDFYNYWVYDMLLFTPVQPSPAHFSYFRQDIRDFRVLYKISIVD